jgi:uncharacterized protein YdaU (DUF1376 family)
MAKKPAFLCYPSDFITGALRLSPEQKGVYYTLVMLMYDARSPIPDDLAELARFCGCSWQKFRVIRNELVAAGKIIELDDGRLSNDRFERELDRQKLAAPDGEQSKSEPSSKGASPTSSPPHKPRHEGQDEPRHEPEHQNFVAAENNGLADDSRARVRTESARASSNPTSISNKRVDSLCVDKALAAIVQRMPNAIGREQRDQWRKQIFDFAQQDGIDPLLDLLPCAIADFNSGTVPKDLRSMGWWRKNAIKRMNDRLSRPQPEPVPDLTNEQWVTAFLTFLDPANGMRQAQGQPRTAASHRSTCSSTRKKYGMRWVCTRSASPTMARASSNGLARTASIENPHRSAIRRSGTDAIDHHRIVDHHRTDVQRCNAPQNLGVGPNA